MKRSLTPYSTTETRASFIILVLSCYKKYLDSAMFMLNTLNFAYNLLITLPGIVLFLVGRIQVSQVRREYKFCNNNAGRMLPGMQNQIK